ncbi:MAG: PEP-CTERM sorting domain-containing protein [Pseudomonadota bacterium]|nr:PEP-CTERM sorting domain-containing protein [Pseudomonadota bacterium]
MTRLAVLAFAGLSVSLVSPVRATTFVDQTFNLSDYTITQSLQVGTATVTQTQSGGNPSPAIEVDYVIPAVASSGSELGSVFYLNKNFTYDPASNGALASLTFMIDKNIDIVRPPSTGVTNGQSFLIFQGGSYYVDAVALGSKQNVFHTADLTAGAGDFSLITNLSSGAVDSSVHPSFAGGLMEFGFRNGFVFDPQTAAEVRIVEDNFSVALTPAVPAVPEPESYALLLAGLGLVGWRACARNRRALPEAAGG